MMQNLFTEIKENKGHYLVLLFILIFGGVSMFYFQRFPQAQVVSVFLTASFYVLWGVIHHYIKGDLHPRIVLEYLAVALLGFLILWSIINRT